MGAPKGNQNGKGNKGGGRKSAYQEQADAEYLWNFFFKEHDKEEIRQRLASGKYSVSDVFLTKAYAGDMKAMIAVFMKLFPDKIETKEDKTLKIDV